MNINLSAQGGSAKQAVHCHFSQSKAAHSASTLQLPSSFYVCEHTYDNQLTGTWELTELICYGDSSARLLGCVIFARIKNDKNEHRIHFLFAKQKIVSMKATRSLPKLELHSLLLAAQAADFIRKEWRAPHIKLLLVTDSSVPYWWCLHTNPSSLANHIAKPVLKIRQVFGTHIWHVFSSHNVADLLTRPDRTFSEDVLCLWLHGPPYLRSLSFPPSGVSAQKKPDRPDKELFIRTMSVSVFFPFARAAASALSEKTVTSPDESTEIINKHQELKEPISNGSQESHWNNSTDTIRNAAVQTHTSQIKKANYENCLFPPEQKGTWQGMLQLTAAVMHAVDLFRSHPKRPFIERLNEATNYWLRLLQDKFFKETKLALVNNEKLEAQLRKLRPEYDRDDGLIKIRGRIYYNMGAIKKPPPILLPNAKEDPILIKIVDHFHKKAFCAGTAQTVSGLRSKYWLINANQIAKSIIRRCITCERSRATLLKPRMGLLPPERFVFKYPFANTITDCLGPLQLKSETVYVIGFVCLATRASHLEVIPNLTARSILSSIIRFISRRGIPESILSDNATSYTKVGKFLRTLHSQEIQDKLKKYEINWRHQIPLASHANGAVEIFMKLIRSCLKKSRTNVGHMSLSSFTDLIHLVEKTLNSRPLL